MIVCKKYKDNFLFSASGKRSFFFSFMKSSMLVFE